MYKEQKLVLNNLDSFELEDIFECGQCFRWNNLNENTYIGVIKQGVLKVVKQDNTITFEGILDGDINSIVYEYFDLATDYSKLKEKLSKVDANMRKATQYGKGIRILNQDLWEMIISYIISANNNIPRIKGIIEKISKKCGTPIQWKGITYYLFPTETQLAKLSKEDLRALGTGFRDVRIYNTTRLILDKKITLQEIRKIDDIDSLEKRLLELDGVGEKVANCIMLFGLHRFDTFPVDVWVRRVMNKLYIKNEDETKVSKKQIRDEATKRFGNIRGLAQQYLFFWARETIK